MMTMQRSAHGKGPFAAPVNTFGHARTLLTAEQARAFGVVSPNNDTLYSIAAADVGPEPLVLRVPEIRARYYVLQIFDAWTINFAYVGRRSAGERAGEFLLVAPGWSGEAPAGMRVIHAPTRHFTVGGRFLVNGAADIPNVARLQDALALTRSPSTRGRPIRRPAPSATGRCPSPTRACPRR
jgi:hypothetical protein